MTAFGPDTNGTVIQYPKESFPNWVFTFSKNSMMQWEGSPPGVRDAVDPTDHKRRTLAKYSVNKSRTPHQIDVTYENGLYREKTAHGIYRIMNESGEDVLTIRLPTDPTKGIHPTAFGVVGKEGCLTIRMRKRTAVSD